MAELALTWVPECVEKNHPHNLNIAFRQLLFNPLKLRGAICYWSLLYLTNKKSFPCYKIDVKYKFT